MNVCRRPTLTLGNWRGDDGGMDVGVALCNFEFVEMEPTAQTTIVENEKPQFSLKYIIMLIF